MQLIEVKTPKDTLDFLLLPLKIYKGDANWIRPLDDDINFVFDEKKNKFFKHGECTRWILKSDSGEVTGRVAAFVNKKLSHKNPQPTGGMGFFECINDKTVAFKLFDACKEWLQQRGMEAMDGPINFGERDNWWGLLVEGFTPTSYKINYNPPYYQSFFEAYGFKDYFRQFFYALDVKTPLQEKFLIRHSAIKNIGEYTAKHIEKNKLKKFAEDFRIIYNKAWAKFGGGKELESKQVQLLFNKMKPIIDEKIIWFVYHKGEPVGCWVNIPNINEIFKKFNGRFGIIQKIRFVLQLKTKRTKRFCGIVFGVIPEHQGKGVDSFLIVEAAKVIQQGKLYDDFEMQWIGDFNPKMISIAESLGTWKNRIMITYRKLFDETQEFKRHPIV